MTSKPPFSGEVVRLGGLISKAEIERCGDQQLPVFSMTMHDGIVRQSDRFKKAIASKDTSNYKVVYPHQLVVGFPIDEGVVYVQNFDEPGIMSPAYNVWNIDSSQVDPAYLELALHSPQTMTYYKVQMKGTTARRRTLSTDKLQDVKVPLPALEKQRKVVKLFRQVRGLLLASEARETTLDSLVKSRFVEMFGDPMANPIEWQTDTLGNLGTCKNGLNFKAEDSGYEVACLGVGDFGNRSSIQDMSLLGKVRLSGKPKEDCFLRDGDIVFVRSNGNKALVGRCLAVYPHDSELVYSGFCIRFRLESNTLRVPYLVWTLKQPTVRTQLMGRGSNVKNLNQRILSSLEVPIPPIELQDEFISFAARVDKLRVEAQKQKDELQTLYDSLTQDYFAI